MQVGEILKPAAVESSPSTKIKVLSTEWEEKQKMMKEIPHYLS